MKSTLLYVLGIGIILGWWAVLPIVNYAKGTSVGVSSEVLSQPFLGGPSLVYRWSGDVHRSCAITVRRTITDSDNVVTHLTPLKFDAMPVADLGVQVYEISVLVPLLIAEGPATYQATEVPRCNWLQRLAPVGVPWPPVDFYVTR